MNRAPTDGAPDASPLLALARYLSDEIAPMLVAEDVEASMTAPVALLQTVRTWVVSQLTGSSGRRMSDYVFHAVKKLHLLAELELVDRAQMAAVLREVVPQLIADCPPGEQQGLLDGIGRIGQEEAVLSTPLEYIHRPGGGGARADGGGPAAGPGSGPSPPAQASAPAPEQTAAAVDGLSRGLTRLHVLLDRFEALDDAPGGGAARPGDPSAGDAAPSLPGRPVASPIAASAQAALLGEIVARLASEATSPATFASQLDLLGGTGVHVSPSALVRQLGRGLPDWVPPVGPGGDITRTAAPLRAIRSVVALSKGSDQAMHRFGELVGVAVEEFNGGSLGRAATLIELASKMIADGEVDPTVVRSVTGEAFASLDQERLRVEAESDDTHPMLRRVVTFFPQLAAEELLLQLEVEGKRERRRFLIEMLRVHGHPARALALKALEDSVAGERPLSWYVERNMIHVLRRVPRRDDERLDREIGVLARSSELEGPLPLVREALAGLGTIRHPDADALLVARVGEVERALLGQRELPHDADELRGLLDRLIASLVGRTSGEVRRCVVEHGLRRKAALGNCAARMAALGRHDLSDQPTVVGRILDALQAELPVQVLGVTVASKRRAEAIRNVLESLRGTDSEDVRQALQVVASGYRGQSFAARAEEILGSLGAPQAPADEGEDGPSAASMAGDLELFGLPNLLQNLADNRLTGELQLESAGGGRFGEVLFDTGSVVSAACGRLRGEVALYRMLERPEPGRFAFTRRPLEPEETDGTPLPVVPVLLEGMRRYDELARAVAVVPDHMRLDPVAAEPPAVDDEADHGLVRAVWAAMAAGRTAAECETVGEVDPFRVRRLLERWFESGAAAAADAGGR